MACPLRKSLGGLLFKLPYPLPSQKTLMKSRHPLARARSHKDATLSFTNLAERESSDQGNERNLCFQRASLVG